MPLWPLFVACFVALLPVLVYVVYRDHGATKRESLKQALATLGIVTVLALLALLAT